MSKNPPATTSKESWRLAGLVPEKAKKKSSPLESIPEEANEKPSTAPSPVKGMRNLLEMNSAKGEDSKGSQK